MRILLLLFIFSLSTSEKHAYIISSSAGDLPSAFHDVMTYSTIMKKIGYTTHYILDLTPNEMKSVDISENVYTNLNVLPQLLSSLTDRDEAIITLSSHGFLSTFDSDYYIKFGNDVYTHSTIMNWIYTSKAKTLVIIDTCHSGGICPVYLKPKDTSHITILTSCSESEMDNDDISYLGFGGGLTTAIADYINIHYVFSLNDIDNIYKYCQERLAKMNQHARLIRV